MSKLFLSHNTEDKPFVQELGRRLQDMGVGVWIDEAEIKVGDSLLKKISSGITDCSFLVAVLSPRSVRSSWVQFELETASTMEIDGKTINVLPVVIEDCAVPTFLLSKKYADFREKDKFDHAFEELLRAVLPYDLRDMLKGIVKNAAHAELAAYKALPSLSEDRLLDYFSKNGSALARIVHLLQRHKDRNWTISNEGNPSTCEVFGVEVISIRNGVAELQSREYWYLRWYDGADHTYKYVLNETIEPTHILKHESDGQWRIEVQQYTTSTCYVG